MNHYHNTTNENEAFVKDAKKKCITQEDEVLEIMQELKQATASEVWKKFGYVRYASTPLTSIRRALSNLCYIEGKLMKSTKKKIGLYGKPECYYTLIETTIRTTV